MISPEQLQGLETMGRIAGTALPYLQKHGQGMGALAGKIVGFGKDEGIHSVPKWSWFAVGVVAGTAFTALVVPAIKRRIG